MKFNVIAPARLSTGVLVLTKDQSSPRMHNLKAVGKDRFEIVKPVEFKAGEVIGYEGELPKSLATVMVDESGIKKEPTKKAKAEAAAKARTGADAKANFEARFTALEAEIKTLQGDLSKALNAEAAAEIEAKILAKAAELDALIG